MLVCVLILDPVDLIFLEKTRRVIIRPHLANFAIAIPSRSEVLAALRIHSAYRYSTEFLLDSLPSMIHL